MRLHRNASSERATSLTPLSCLSLAFGDSKSFSIWLGARGLVIPYLDALRTFADGCTRPYDPRACVVPSGQSTVVELTADDV